MSFIFEEDIFDVKDINRDGQFFEKVSRVHATSENYETELVVDVASQAYPMAVGEKFSFALASTLSLDGAPDDGMYDPARGRSLADKFDYVMHGRVFNANAGSNKSAAAARSQQQQQQQQHQQQQQLTVHASFGGLLMELKGDPRNLQTIETDANIYLLIRKI